MIVADANAILPLVRQSSFTLLARQAFEKDPAWIVPPLWQPEVLNALLREIKAGFIDLDGALEAVRLAEDIFRHQVRHPSPADILRISRTSGLTAYDATYVSLARELGVRLLTEDGQILRACPDTACSLHDFVTPTGTSQLRESVAPYKVKRAVGASPGRPRKSR